MKLYLPCMKCLPNNHESVEVEYIEEGYYYFECSKGHKNFVVLQEQKFETLFQIGAHAIYDGYYREAVSSFTSSLERFYEFCVQIFCTKQNIKKEKITEACKFYNKSSERQFGSFIFLYLIEFDELPFSKKDDDKWRNFRNEVIHNGLIPTKEQALEYGEHVRLFILKNILKLQKDYNSELQKITSENICNRANNNKYDCNTTTMCQGNIISLANGEIEKLLEINLYSEILSMKKMENGMKLHSNLNQ